MIRLRHLKTGFRFLRHRFSRLHPFEVQAQLLNACDTRCVYCRCPDVETPLLTTDQWKTIIRSLGRLGTLRIKFQGGEPTLRDDFRELCTEAKRAGMITATITNGLRISNHPELLDFLDEVVISLDSVKPEVNDFLRGKGATQAALKAIHIAKERGVRAYINMALSQKNLDDVEAMLEFCEGKGILLHIQPILFGREYYDDQAKPIGLTTEQIREIHLKLLDWKKQGRGLLFSQRAYAKPLMWPHHPALTIRSVRESSCRAGKDYFHIQPDGEVTPCIQYSADFNPKNITLDGFKEALRHAQHHNCRDCWTVYLNERKLLFSLKPSALWAMIRRG